MERKASSPVVRAEPEQQKLEAVEQPSHRPSPVRDLIPSKIEKQPKRHAPSTSLAKYVELDYVCFVQAQIFKCMHIAESSS